MNFLTSRPILSIIISAFSFMIGMFVGLDIASKDDWKEYCEKMEEMDNEKYEETVSEETEPADS